MKIFLFVGLSLAVVLYFLNLLYKYFTKEQPENFSQHLSKTIDDAMIESMYEKTVLGIETLRDNILKSVSVSDGRWELFISKLEELSTRISNSKIDINGSYVLGGCEGSNRRESLLKRLDAVYQSIFIPATNYFQEYYAKKFQVAYLTVEQCKDKLDKMLESKPTHKSDITIATLYLKYLESKVTNLRDVVFNCSVWDCRAVLVQIGSEFRSVNCKHYLETLEWKVIDFHKRVDVWKITPLPLSLENNYIYSPNDNSVTKR